ncbi:MAG: hypothetical protein ACI8T1_003259 [Verrucomicrobiales bacterium]
MTSLRGLDDDTGEGALTSVFGDGDREGAGVFDRFPIFDWLGGTVDGQLGAHVCARLDAVGRMDLKAVHRGGDALGGPGERPAFLCGEQGVGSAFRWRSWVEFEAVPNFRCSGIDGGLGRSRFRQ